MAATPAANSVSPTGRIASGPAAREKERERAEARLRGEKANRVRRVELVRPEEKAVKVRGHAKCSKELHERAVDDARQQEQLRLQAAAQESKGAAGKVRKDRRKEGKTNKQMNIKITKQKM
jgi:hypothetical protein